MSPAAFKSIRKQAGLTQSQLAERLRVGDRHVRMIEAGDRAISGPIEVLMEQLSSNKPISGSRAPVERNRNELLGG